MAIPYYGDFAEDDTVNIPFNTFDSNDPSASVTITNLADADIKVHKDAHVDQIVTDGATVVIDFDGITGNHMINIDTSVDAAYATGSEYQVRIEGTTVDGATVNGWVGTFSIERAGGVLARLETLITTVGAAGVGLTDVNVKTISNDAITPASVDEDADFVIQALSITNALDAGSVIVDAGMDIVGALTANSVSIDTTMDVVGAWSANSLLIDTTATVSGAALISGTTTHTGAVTFTGGLVSDVTGSITGDLSGSVGTCAAATVSAMGAAVIDAASIKADAITEAKIADNAIAGEHLNATACTKIIDDFETQSQADPTGFHVNVKEVNGTGQTANDNGADINEILADTNELELDWKDGGRLDLILDTAGAAGDPWATAIPGAYEIGTAGKIVGDNINAPLDTIDANVDSILADTGELQVDDYPTSIAAIQTTVDAIEVSTVTNAAGVDIAADIIALKAETATILTDTNELQTDDIPGKLAAIDTLIDGIKAVTDALTAAAATKLAASAMTMILGTVGATDLTTTTCSTDISLTDGDQLNGRIIIFAHDTTTNGLKHQATNISDFVVANGVLTFTAVTTAPSAGDTFVVL